LRGGSSPGGAFEQVGGNAGLIGNLVQVLIHYFNPFT
jgi:hypothetical protein